MTVGDPGQALPTYEDDSGRYRQFITGNDEYIKNQCLRLCSNNQNQDDSQQTDAIELWVDVIDCLKENNFKRLREFEGRSGANIRTYIATIISSRHIDRIRSRKTGRSRAWDRARALGPAGEKIYDLLYRRGYDEESVCHALQTAHQDELSYGQITEIIVEIKGNTPDYRKMPEGFSLGKHAVKPHETESGDLIVQAHGKNPEEELIDTEERNHTRKLLDELLSNLSGEEQLVIRMFYPLEEESEPVRPEDIAAKLNMTKEMVGQIKRKAIAKCRKLIEKKRLKAGDFF